MNIKTHTDIKLDNWIHLYCPESIKPYAYLARLDRPIGIWLLLLPGWWAIAMSSGGIIAMSSGGIIAMNSSDWYILFLFAIGAVVMRAAGCIINDLWDRELDKKVKRTHTRPIAAGDLSIKQAFIFLFFLLFLGFIILIQMNVVTVLLGFLCLPLIIAYPLMKRWTWWPQAFLGFVSNFGVLMGWTAITGIIELPTLLLYASGILWTLGYDTIYAYQDREDDVLAGIKSTALKFGENAKIWVCSFFCFSWLLLSLSAIIMFKFHIVFLLLPAALHLYWQMKHWKADNAESSLNIFKSNMIYGLLVLVAFLI